MYRYQPFIVSLFLGYKQDLNGAQLTSVMYELCLIWEYFSGFPKTKKVKITEKTFQKYNLKNVRLLSYLNKEGGGKDYDSALKENTASIKSAALVAEYFGTNCTTVLVSTVPAISVSTIPLISV